MEKSVRYFAIISYNGTRYYGWQKQAKSENTIQFQIDRVLKMLLKAEIETMGCGRTDSGVHAKGFYLHFDSSATFDIKELIYKMNTILPSDIVVNDIFEVDNELHARFNATSRSYVYRLKTIKDPFDLIHFYYKYGELDVENLNKIALEILNFTDFHSYCKTHTDVKTTICTVTHSEWKLVGNTYEYHITANRFLRGMIRLLVGMMLNYQKDKFSLEEVKASFNDKKKLPLIWSVPPEGLILHNIKYGDNFPSIKESLSYID